MENTMVDNVISEFKFDTELKMAFGNWIRYHMFTLSLTGVKKIENY